MAEPTRDPQEVLEAIDTLKATSREVNELQAVAKRWYIRESDAVESTKQFASISSACSASDKNMTDVREQLPTMLVAYANSRAEVLAHFKAEFLDVLTRFIDGELRLAEKAQKKNADARLDFDAKSSDYQRLQDSRSAKSFDIDLAKRKMDDAEQAYSTARREFLNSSETCQEKKATLFKSNIGSFATSLARASEQTSDAAQSVARHCN